MGRSDPQVWAAMLSHLRQNHPQMCRNWFQHIQPYDLAGPTVLLLVREQVQLKYLRRAFTQQFVEAAQAVTGRLVPVQFIGEEDIGDDGRVLAGNSSSFTGKVALPDASVAGRSSSSSRTAVTSSSDNPNA